MKPTACCFTGYRPEKFPFSLNDNEEYLKFENSLLDIIFSLNKKGCSTFYSGVAMGFDLIAAEIVLLLKNAHPETVNLICVVPFASQSETWPREWKDRYKNVIGSADEIITLSEDYFPGCYQRRNEFMVDRSDIVLTYFDGKKGGTKNTIGYAKRKGLEIINLSEDNPDDKYYGEVLYLFND